MHLFIDVREACKSKRTGKGQWAFGFVSALLQKKKDITLISDRPLPSSWKKAGANEIRVSGAGMLWHMRVAWRMRKLHGHYGCAYLSPTSFIIPALIGASVPCIPVVHDLIAFRREPHDRKARWIERLTLRRALRHAAHVCTVSDATKKDLLARFPSLDGKKVTPVYAGPMNEMSERNRPDDRTILCIATLCPRKNQERLIHAYRLLPDNLRERFRLLLVGARGWDDQPIIHLAEQVEGVEWIDYVDDAEYEHLLSTCTVFALPSLYEGFGMQILDALQRGIPVLTSHRGSLAEVAGDAAVIVNPENVRDITAGLERLLTDADLRADLAKKGPQQAARFSWKRSVDIFLELAKKRASPEE